MNKNIIKLFAILMLCFMIGSVLVACGAQGEQGETGPQGAPGAEGPQGPQGPAGDSAYIGENGNWWVGETDTGVKAEPENLVDCEEHDYNIYNEDGSLKVENGNHWVLDVHTQDTVGCTLWVCVDCGDSYLEWVDHDYAAVVTEPTCTTTGYTTYTCDCGLTYVDDETEMVAHNYGDWEDSLYDDSVTLCECERPTIQVRFCVDCGAKDPKENVIPAKGHTFLDENWEPSINKTEISPCEQAPLLVNYCSVCNHKECNKTIVDPEFDGVIPNHTWGEWTVVTAPTANSTGLIKKVCTVCGANYKSGVETKELPALNKDDYTHAVVTAPDCDSTGKDTYTYVVDGQSIVIDVVTAANGHDYTNAEYKVTKLPAYAQSEEDMVNCTGTVEFYCVVCGEAHEVEIPALGKLTGRFIVDMGDCLDPTDTYNMPIQVVEGKPAEYITFEVEGNYVHDEEPASSELTLLEGEGKWYWAYWCTKCEHWIIVDYTDVNPNA